MLGLLTHLQKVCILHILLRNLNIKGTESTTSFGTFYRVMTDEKSPYTSADSAIDVSLIHCGALCARTSWCEGADYDHANEECHFLTNSSTELTVASAGWTYICSPLHSRSILG